MAECSTANDRDKLAIISRRSFFKYSITAAVGSTVLMFCPSILNLEKAYAVSPVRFHDISQLPTQLSGQYVASTIHAPKRIEASGVYIKKDHLYYVLSGNTATIKLVNCGTDADGNAFDVHIVIGPIEGLDTSFYKGGTYDGGFNYRQWLVFYVDAGSGQFGWWVETFCAQGWVKIRYYKTGTTTPANVKIFGTFSDIDQAQGTVSSAATNGIKGGNEGICFTSQNLDVYYKKSGTFLTIDSALGGAFCTRANTAPGTDGYFDDRTSLTITKDAAQVDIYYSGASCGIYFSFKLPGGVVKYLADGKLVHSEVWSAGSWHTPSSEATTAGDKKNCSGQFQAWYTDSSYKTRYAGSTLGEGTINLYGRNFAVIHYRVDGSSKDVYTETIQVGAQHVASANATNAAKKAGCTPGFKGWYTDLACTNKYSGQLVTGDIYLYAKNVLTVHYRVDGSSSDVYAKQVVYGTSYVAEAAATNAAKKPNCTPGFTGWCTDSACNNKYNSSTLTRDLYLYAKNMLTIKFLYSPSSDHRSGITYYDRPGDSARPISIASPGNKVVMAGSKVALASPRTVMFASLPDNHWVTYRFRAWSSNSDMSGAMINQIMPVHDSIVYAKWVEAPVDGVEDSRELL